jgi:hypothetical protein
MGSMVYVHKLTFSDLLIFAIHQLIATAGVIVTTAFLTFHIAPNLPPVQGHINRGIHWILTETPFFPLQIGFGGLLSYLIYCGRFRHWSMVWVWVLPFLWLAAALLGLISGPSEMEQGSRFAHFFGWGCQPRFHCFDQLGFTLPFYSSAAYSSGALLGKLTTKRQPLN